MSTSSGRTALVVGATGLVGGYVVACLARRTEWTRIVVLARRPVDTAGGRVEHRVVDFEALGPADLDGADDVFACLGTTIKKAGSEEAFMVHGTFPGGWLLTKKARGSSSNLPMECSSPAFSACHRPVQPGDPVAPVTMGPTAAAGYWMPLSRA